jgi:hypothetical protein
MKLASTVGRCINLLECCITAIEKWHQQLERASIVGMVIKVPQHLEGASNVGMET